MTRMHLVGLKPMTTPMKVLFEQELIGEINGLLLLLFKNHAAFDTIFNVS